MYQVNFKQALSNNKYLQYGLFILLLFNFFLVSAGEQKYNAHYTGSNLSVNTAPLQVKDERYPQMIFSVNWRQEFTNRSAMGRVRLKWDGSEEIHYHSAWSLELVVDVEAWDEDGQPLPSLNGEQLIIEYDPNGSSINEVVLPVPNAHYLKVNLIQVLPNGFPNSIPDDINLQAEIEVDRVYSFDITNVPDIEHQPTSFTAIRANSNQVELKWSALEGAESYDLEWVYVPHSEYLIAQPTLPSEISREQYTRITSSANRYMLNLAYDKGKLFYRVRGVGLFGDQYDMRQAGDWTDDATHVIAIDENVEADKNWQYNATYAEEGKRKEVLSFYDGTLRERQAVTYLNTDKAAIIGENFYDYEGRAVAQSMPVPDVSQATPQEVLDFYPDFNQLEIAQNSYSNIQTQHLLVDDDSDQCELPVSPWSDASGAVKYYSEVNPLRHEGFHGYIPNSEGYAYSQTRYDRRGQVVEQSAPGKAFQLGGEHSTSYFDVTPPQEKLDRLFGNEVGFAKHYRMKGVQDANGQYSISYENLAGQVIASALVGDADNLLPLGKNPQNMLFNQEHLNEWSPTEQAYVVKNEFFAEHAGSSIPYTFTYSISPEVYEDLCQSQQHDCHYILTISIVDQCGRKIYDTDKSGIDPSKNKVLHQDIPLTVGQTIPNGLASFEVYFPDEGVYTITKTLRLDEAKLAKAAADFRKDIAPNCLSIVDIRQNFLNTRDYENCSSCAEIASDPTFCAPDYQPNCDVLKDLMIADMSPGGQYFDNWLNGEAPLSPDFSWMAANLWSDGTNSNWTALALTDANGTAITTWTALRANWDPSFATKSAPGLVATYTKNGVTVQGNALWKLHPEYCRYTTCVALEASSTFDASLWSVNTFAEAVSLDFIPANPSCSPFAVGELLVDKDPFFNSSPTANSQQKLAMEQDFSNPFGRHSILCMWEEAAQMASDNGCTTDCDNQTWQNFRVLYLGKKWEFVNEYSTGQCEYLCDQDLPTVAPSSFAGNCDPVPTAVGKKILVPNNYEQMMDLVEKNPTSGTPTENNLNAWGNSVKSNYGRWCDEFVQNGSFNDIITIPSSGFNFFLPVGNVPGWTNGQREIFNNTSGQLEDVTPDINLNGNSAVMWAKDNDYGEVVVNELNQPLVAGQEYSFSYKVKSINFTDWGICNSTRTEVDNFYVTLSNNPDFLGTTNTDVSNQELLHINQLGTNLVTVNDEFLVISLTFTAKDNYQYLHLSHKGKSDHCGNDEWGNAQWISYDDVSILGSCPDFEELDCFCTDLSLAVDAYKLDHSNASESQVNMTLAANMQDAAGITVTALEVLKWRENCRNSNNTDAELGNDIVPDELRTCENQRDDCRKEVDDIVGYYADLYYGKELDRLTKEFIAGYRAKCLPTEEGSGNFAEFFTIEGQDHEQQITLYYYDRAGNLVRTVPPEGVEKLSDAEITNVNLHRKGFVSQSPVYPKHRMETEYFHNSLNQLVAQSVPDADEIGTLGVTSRFWYDDLGRLKASQQANQYTAPTSNKEYSYTVYDELGRVKESGEAIAFIDPTPSYLNSAIWPGGWAGNKREITSIYYDKAAAPSLNNYFGNEGQTNLRSRVSAVTYKANLNDATPQTAMHYSYDIHGNVQQLLQEHEELREVGGFKLLEYEYDLISGNVNVVHYQKGEADQFTHRYCYDADNRITGVWTSHDNHIWDREARYFYYLHGPLARTEIGEQKVQGMDYAYTLQGWLKGVNSNLLNEQNDIGRDGLNLAGSAFPYSPANADLHDGVARDAMGFSLGYYDDDYLPINASNAGVQDFTGDLMVTNGLGGNDLYNGNIRRMATALSDLNGTALQAQLTSYRYDQLNRLRAMDVHQTGTNWASATPTDDYKSRYTYDKNGNIESLSRYGNNAQLMDDFSYDYELVNVAQQGQGQQWEKRNNRLYAVQDDRTISASFPNDLDDQSDFVANNVNLNNNYAYDKSGNLIKDEQEEIEEIKWNVQGKVSEIIRTSNSTKPDLEFRYDVNGNRRLKIVKPRIGGLGLSGSEMWSYNHYILDATGNVMAIYEQTSRAYASDDAYYPGREKKLFLTEQPIYGSQRLGIRQGSQLVSTTIIQDGQEEMENIKGELSHQRNLGQKAYELGNHLGNVLAVVSDEKQSIADLNGALAYYQSDVQSFSDYYPFGMQQPGRNGRKSEGYRYGFNGQEKDDEIAGAGNSYTAQFWQYDSRLGRRWNLDPKPNPAISEYATFANNPIFYIDVLGDTVYIYNVSPDLSIYGVLGHTALGVTDHDNVGNTGENNILYLPASGNMADWRTEYIPIQDGSGAANEINYIDEQGTVNAYVLSGDDVQRLKVSLPLKVEQNLASLINGYSRNNNQPGCWCTSQVKSVLKEAFVMSGYSNENAQKEVDKLVPYFLPEILNDKEATEAGYESIDTYKLGDNGKVKKETKKLTKD